MWGWYSSRGINASRVRKVICPSGNARRIVSIGDVARTISPMELKRMARILRAGAMVYLARRVLKATRSVRDCLTGESG